MKVGIVGAGGIGCGTAAFLLENGHAATLWSPSGARTRTLAEGEPLRAEGALEGAYRPAIAHDAQQAVAGMDAVLIAAPGYAHRTLFDAIAPFIKPGQVVIVSAHYAFGALCLARILAERGVVTPIVAWSTTITTGKQAEPGHVRISTIRSQIDMATVPAHLGETGRRACAELFGERFIERPGGLMAIALSNLNPQNHMALVLTNLTRIERAEDWKQFYYYTPAVGALVEALDAERLAIAEQCGCTVRSIFEHLHLSYHVPEDTVSNMIQTMYARGGGGFGPKSLDTRYVTEDCPYGLVVTALLGRKAGRPALLHESGIALLSALYARDFRTGNDLLDAIDFEDMTIEDIRERAETGYAAR